MKKYILLTVSILSLSTNTVHALQWSQREFKDEMTGNVVSYRASSDWSETENPMLPGSNEKMYSWVNIECNSSTQWAFIAFTQKPYMGSGNTIQQKVVTRIKFDDNRSEVTLHSGARRSPAVLVDNAEKFIKQIRNSKTMKIEFPWYQYGNIYLDYDLAGSEIAISDTLSKCKTLK
ncbi:hypothetical protein WKW34_11810 [Vibrio alginolyticus]|uniref:hypothetical protein n=1 Tax=Vibrio alginolyticus TaxID=663 RepID=UPI0037541A1D